MPKDQTLSEMFLAVFEESFEALRAEFIKTDTLEEFYNLSAQHAAKPVGAQFAEGFGDALILAHLLGRAEVLEELDESESFVDFDYANLPFKEQIEFFRGKVNLPTNEWTDLLREGHDRAFVVAGANQIEIVEDFRQAIDRAMSEGTSFREFQQDFDDISAKHGWDYRGEREWRARTIYETNMRTAFMAGRFDQMSHPDVTTTRPYWQYMHGETRQPKIPRKSHQAWSGLILRYDDPFWQKHFPPNDWKCSCGVRTLSDRDLERMEREVDAAPDRGERLETIRTTGERVSVPNGVGLGWDYQPGRTWSQGLVPKELHTPLELPAAARTPDVTLSSLSKPFTSEKLTEGLSDEIYARAFLNPFGADIGRGVLFRDKAGQMIAITDELLRDGAGVLKSNKFGRGPYMAQLAESIYDPDEIWVNWQFDTVQKRWRLARNYIRAAPNEAGFAAFSYRDGLFWSGNTTFSPRKKARVRMNYLENLRQGALLYRR